MRIRTMAAGLMVVALAMSAGLILHAQDKALEVLAAAREAIGGKKLESLDTLSVEASLERNLDTMRLASEIEILLDLPDKYLRSDQSSGPMAGNASVGFNGDQPIRPANGAVMAGGRMMIRMGPGGPPPPNETLSPEEQNRADEQMLRLQRADISRLMLGWFAMAHPAVNARYTYAGEAESPDGKAHVIDATNAEGFAARLFIDQQTNLPLMVTYQGPQPRTVTVRRPGRGGAGRQVRAPNDDERKEPGKEDERLAAMRSQAPTIVAFTLFFDDWREVGGVKFPHRIRRASGGTTNEEWTVNKVRLNPKFDQKRFDAERER